MEEFAKAYEPQKVEDAIYAKWLESGYFTPENLPGDRKESFSIVLPPPNVTGTLHMGHATMLAIEDAMVRFARLSGKKTLWLPGTDHAAIATQSKVEGIIFKEEGKTRHDLGREKFLERVKQFAQESHDTIVNQSKKMGSSMDWTREAYTLDEARNRAVNVAFKRMYDDGLIYQGDRIVNWDPVGQTTISDDELVYKEEKNKFYYFKYGPFVIGTARPETKFGDKYVVMHPDDERYAMYKDGQTIALEWINGPITATIVKDAAIDMTFGTGVMTITPWHSQVDFDIAQRHGLEKEQVIDLQGRLLPIAGEFSGMKIHEVRENIVQKLEQKGLIERIEEGYVHNVATAERSGGLVEPQILKQWFIGVNKEFTRNGKQVTLKSLMQDAVRGKQVDILPERFEKTYFHWIDNLRDWNISRQIWFGHRVPVWYRGKEIAVGEAPGADWEQDPDTLDTWFSSGLWTFSTLGWPDENSPDLKTFHPTSVLETGYDILFFWVARMILMSTYLLDEVPFKTVYLHGLVRDEQGRKMSKSLGNIINPLDMIAKYGADATRLSLVIGSAPGNDIKLSEDKIAGFRNFTNKLWNISRFVDMMTGGLRHVEKVEPKTLADHWILGQFSHLITEVGNFNETYQLSLAGESLRTFAWDDFADWYVEIAKVQCRDETLKDSTEKILNYILERLLVVWHPFMPFVTEEIYTRYNRGMLIVASWPTDVNFTLTKQQMIAFETLRWSIGAIRNIRAEYKVEPKKLVDVVVSDESLVPYTAIIQALARVENLSVGEKPQSAATAVVGSTEISVPLSGMVDATKERTRLTDEIANIEKYLVGMRTRMENEEFVKNAPEKVVAGEKAKLAEAEARLAKLQQSLTSLE